MKCWNVNKHPILYPTRAADRAVIRNSIPFDVPAGYELPAAMKYLVLLYIVGFDVFPQAEFSVLSAGFGVWSDRLFRTLQITKNSF